jgi:hypothetical protein
MKTFLCSHLVTVRCGGRESAANLERISRDIATLNAEDPLPAGAPVTLLAAGCELKGTVLRSFIEISGHETDISLEHPWSPETFLPDHLFDPDVIPHHLNR